MTRKTLFVPLLEKCLPWRILNELHGLSQRGIISGDNINEIRLRTLRPASVTCGEKNIMLGIKTTAAELSECVTELCHGSVYAYSDTIKAGYIQPGEGIRVGVCGTLAADGRAVREITSINIRIPHIIRGVCEQLMGICCGAERVKSTLIYSPPGVGKTTALREIASRLGGPLSRRVALIDTRGELYIPEMFSETMCDVLTGYSRAAGIEIATRTLSPEVIICDELGDSEEAAQILGCAGAGVPIIASAHASSLYELLARPNIRMLHNNRIFEGYAGLSREYVNGSLSACFSCDYTPYAKALEDE